MSSTAAPQTEPDPDRAVAYMQHLVDDQRLALSALLEENRALRRSWWTRLGMKLGALNRAGGP